MTRTRTLVATAFVGGLLAALPPAAHAAGHPAPASAMAQDSRLLERIEALTQRPGAVGVEARRLLEVMRDHLSYREEVVLPPLALLPRLAAGDVTPDMDWAVALGERVRGERHQLELVQQTLTDRLLAVHIAAQDAGDATAVQETQDVAAFLLASAEVDENMTVAIGTWLRKCLSPRG